MDCSPPGFSVHGILQARILKWVAISYSRGSSQPRDQTRVSCITGRFFTVWTTREAPGIIYINFNILAWILHGIYSFFTTFLTFQIGKKVGKGFILSSCLFNLYAEYIMQNARLDEAQSGIKISRRNINYPRYADDTTLMAESEKELKEPLNESERGEWRSWLKAQHSEN